MYLKKIELQGFKSFPDKISMDFDNVLAVIVGPNGSGKSNIADAVRWALGEQSVKTLRGQKWEDVIFNGTQNRRPLNFAEVTMILDNSDSQIASEYTDVAVTRKVFRSGESEYLINGKNCRLKDVRELFMDTGVGKEGYSIIGQGQVDEILNARSDDRRQIFEEASGIVKYKTRRYEALTKLENEKKNLLRLNDIITEIESNLEPLKEQSETAKRFLELSGRLKLYEVNLFIIEERRLKEEISRLEALYKSTEEAIEEKIRIQLELNSSLSGLSGQNEELSKEIARLRDKIYENRTNQEQKSNSIKISEADAAHLQSDIKRLDSEIEELSNKAEKNREQLELLESKKNSELLLLDSSRKLLESAQEEFEALNAHLTVSEAEIEKHKNDIIKNIRETAEIKSAVSRLKSMLEETSQRKTQINEALSETDKTLTLKQSVITELTERLKEARLLQTSLSEKKEYLLNEKNGLEEKKSALSAEYEGISKAAIKSRERLKVLTVMKQEHEGFFRSVKELMKAVSLAALTGIRGVVGEVIAVKGEHEIALEIALGSNLQNIITVDENAAKRAIEFLKRNSYGRATFLPLTTAKPQNAVPKGILEHRGIIGTAKSLISYDKEFESIMSSLLERVIVAENMQAAIEFSRATRYSYRVVTLNGELISAQGAITGGSLNEKRLNIFSRSREIIEIDERLKSLYESKDDLALRISAADEGISETKEALGGINREAEENRFEINSLEQRLATENGELAAIQDRAASAEIEIAQIDGRLSELAEDIASKERLLTETHAAARDIEEQINQQQSLTQSDKELRDLKMAEMANLRIEMAEISSRLTALGTDKERVSAENAAIIENISAAEKECIQAREKIIIAKEEASAYAMQIKSLKEECFLFERKIVEKEELKLKNQEQIKEINSTLNDTSSFISEMNGEKIRIESRKERQTEELQRLFNAMWEDYEITLSEARKYDIIDETPAKLQRAAKELKGEIRALGNINVSAIEHYKETKERYDFLINQKEDIIAAEEKLREIINQLTDLMEKTFLEQFALISDSFNGVFKEMFGGGSASLELSESNEPLESGIEIVAELPGKKLQNISLLSGGEKALTAIALLFGILKLKPSPFCILDEIEAALDDANIVRFANYLKKLKDTMQFIVITHRKGTMESANVLYGVTMEEQGVSKLISVRMEEAVS